ncbi:MULTISPECIES: cysteine hydrolase family protein [unclassified Curtobacterium]|uniref:cysteine hydrolase family protein n=1 Tax=unclassified Curtobacterium TaxID=257496 RepID=UPI00089E0848|nr:MULTISPECIES: isochorismatase family cysteine hydrolase [unclassified Curtobacterium]AOX66877.1 isochorismatase [Curtobacterium sp. BH-2-1-1]MCC8908300.1 cysteine hydrolase [Curtobacterium sp. GD1]MDR6171175.1 nicotinamidase-related amidase [Curtobacterium sp. SORGH_AS_0776]
MGTALLVMDYQNSIVERLGTDEALAAATAAVSAARERGIPVVFVRVAFRPGAPEAARTNKMFGGMRERIGSQTPGSTDVHSAFGVGDDDLVVTKLRVSAFAGSDLEVLLRGLEVRDLVLAGIATSGVVLSTLRQAADLDFGLTVLSDACADGDAEVHRVLTEKVFPRQAEVVTVAEWTASL